MTNLLSSSHINGGRLLGSSIPSNMSADSVFDYSAVNHICSNDLVNHTAFTTITTQSDIVQNLITFLSVDNNCTILSSKFVLSKNANLFKIYFCHPSYSAVTFYATTNYSSPKNIDITVYGKTLESVKNALSFIKSIFPEREINIYSKHIPLQMWSSSPHGAIAETKLLSTFTWDEVQYNYTASTASKLELMTKLTPSTDSGRLIIWRGIPGTGKSSAIRMLMKEWYPWCDVEYILDPERFFGDAAYMLSVITTSINTDDYYYRLEGNLSEEEIDNLRQSMTCDLSNRWKLLIVEDAEELLTSDAKDRSGQGLSRLLNLSDGLIGQGLNFLCLITTNADIASVHHAIKREGRMLADVEFLKLNYEESLAFLKSIDVEDTSQLNLKRSHHYTIAQLFELKNGNNKLVQNNEAIHTGQYI